MGTRRFLHLLTAGFAVFLLQGAPGVRADDAATPPLSGQVSSTQEGPMEGVVVSAKRAGSTMTVSVLSDAQGHYSFPAGRLPPGHYALHIRAVGYDLTGPGMVDIPAQKPATLDLALRKTKNLSAQLTNSEWLMSMPGADARKAQLLDCMGCHTLERVVKSTHTADEWEKVIPRMLHYVNNTFPVHPQLRVAEPHMPPPEKLRKLAEFLASINLSATAEWQYPLKTLPRPKGEATKVIITEYDLPNSSIEPHDTRMDANGMVWYSNFGEQQMGKLDPATGKVTQYTLPTHKPKFPIGMLDLEPDHDGNYWIAQMYQGGVSELDPKTGSVLKSWAIPASLNTDATQQSMVMPREMQVDGKVWMNDVDTHALYRLDVATGQFESFQPFKEMRPVPAPYGLAVDSHNNLYFMDFGNTYIGKIDAKTGKGTVYPTPTPYSRPRRGTMDAQDRLWFAEYNGNRIAMFDTKTDEFKEWPMQVPWDAPYDVVVDKNGDAWTGSMVSDRITRLDPATGKTVDFLLPRETNIRKVMVDNRTNPVTFWAGNNHSASLVRVEQRD